MNFYATFSIPFIVGVVTMFVVLIVKYGSWIFGLSAADRMRIVKGIPSRQTPLAVWEVVRESLLHRRIFKVNPLLGYMHMSLAFGWFLLIVVGWIETVAYLGFRYVPLHTRSHSWPAPQYQRGGPISYPTGSRLFPAGRFSQGPERESPAYPSGCGFPG